MIAAPHDRPKVNLMLSSQSPGLVSGIRFSTRLSLIFGGLLITSLVIVLLAIDQVARSAALNRIEAALQTSVSTVEALRRQRISKLQQSVRLLAGDYGFKAAYATADEVTIQSALENHKNRLPSIDIMILSDLDGTVITNTFDRSLTGKAFPWPEILDMADESDSGEVTAFAILGTVVYQVIVTPLFAPDIDAWVVSGFRVDDKMASDLASITSSDVSFFYEMNQQVTLISSTLAPYDQISLLSFVRKSERKNDLYHYKTNSETRIGHFLPLNENSRLKVTTFIELSLDQALAPYRKLSQYVLWIFAISVLALLLIVVRASRHVTQSISALSDAAGAVAIGKYDTRVEIKRRDEIGQLANTFNEMTQGLSDKEKMRNLLGKVVSPEIANKLLQDGITLGGEEREVSVLFCDIQGFTRLSESQPAAEVVKALNIFFSEVSDVIEAHHGIIDKYIGDAVMAIFSAPLEDPHHAEHAVRCGIALNQCGKNLNALLPEAMKDGYRFGVGIHSGSVVAGNIGSTNRLNYTVIGDTVNIASRVEGQTRIYDAALLLTEATVERCKNIKFEAVDEVQLKGRTQSVKLFTVTGIQNC